MCFEELDNIRRNREYEAEQRREAESLLEELVMSPAFVDFDDYDGDDDDDDVFTEIPADDPAEDEPVRVRRSARV